MIQVGQKSQYVIVVLLTRYAQIQSVLFCIIVEIIHRVKSKNYSCRLFDERYHRGLNA